MHSEIKDNLYFTYDKLILLVLSVSSSFNPNLLSVSDNHLRQRSVYQWFEKFKTALDPAVSSTDDNLEPVQLFKIIDEWLLTDGVENHSNINYPQQTKFS